MEITVLKNQIRNYKNNPEFTQQLEKALIICADLYTGVNFTTPMSKRDRVLFKTLTNEIYTHFSDLELEDIKNAFSLACAKKIDVNLTTYFGKFNAGILGNVLHEYRKYKNNKICEHYKKIEKTKEIDTSDILIKNAIAYEKTLCDYFKAKAKFLNDDLEETDIKIYWYDSLKKNNIINIEIDKELIEELTETAKIRVKKKLMQDRLNKTNIQLLKNFNVKNSSVKDKVIREMKYLLILKSFMI